MTSIAVARALARTGLVWEPARGDRFVIPDRGMDADVFVLSDMTIEAHEHPTGRVLGFNGTTEWALDSVAASDALWLPREDQLRTALGGAFRSLQRADEGPEGPDGSGGAWWVCTAGPHGLTEHAGPEAEEVYAVALLALRATTARDLLPVAAHGLAGWLRLLGGPDGAGWEVSAPDGVRSLRQAVAAVLGRDPERGDLERRDAGGGWGSALGELLAVWGGPASGGAEVAEAGAQGVLVDLLTLTWDVAASLADPALAPDDPDAEGILDAACVARALAHVRTWGTGADGGAGGAGGGAASPQRELLARTGR